MISKERCLDMRYLPLFFLFFFFSFPLQAAPFAYVTSELDDKVAIINTLSYKLITEITVGIGPVGVSVSPDGSKVYVANYYGGGQGTLSVIDASTRIELYEVDAGLGSNGVAVSPSGTRVYVTNCSDGTVSVFDATQSPPLLLSTVTVDTCPYGVVVSPNGRYVYVGNSTGTTLSVLDTHQTPIFVTQVNSIEIVNPYGVALNASGSRLYVANYKEGQENGTLLIIPTSMIDTTQASVTLSSADVQVITLGKNPYGIAVDTGYAYISNEGDKTISVVNLSNLADPVVTVSSSALQVPYGVSLVPGGNKLAIANYLAGDGGQLSFLTVSQLTDSSLSSLVLGSADIISVSTSTSSAFAFGNFIGPDLPSTLVVSPTSLSFSEQQFVTTSAAQQVLIYYLEDGSPLVGTVAVSGDFAIASTTCGELPTESTVGCTVSITFTPTAVGLRSGSLVIEDEDNNRQYIVFLEGVGIDRFSLGGTGCSITSSPSQKSFDLLWISGGFVLLILSKIFICSFSRCS